MASCQIKTKSATPKLSRPEINQSRHKLSEKNHSNFQKYNKSISDPSFYSMFYEAKVRDLKQKRKAIDTKDVYKTDINKKPTAA